MDLYEQGGGSQTVANKREGNPKMGTLTTSVVSPWSGTDVPLVGDRAAGSPTQGLRALLFELDNVLHDATHWQRWLWQLLTRMGVQRDFYSFCGIWQRGYLHEVYRGGREFAHALRSFLVDNGLSAGQIDEVEAASAARRRELGENLRPLPGVAKTLSQLATRNIGLGILANSECGGQELRARLERLSLAGRFQFVLSSRDLGHVKPEAACYQSALDMLRLPAHAVGVVSCHAEDLMGAAAAGLKTVAINLEAFSHSDFTLPRFEELLRICEAAAAEPVKC